MSNNQQAPNQNPSSQANMNKKQPDESRVGNNTQKDEPTAKRSGMKDEPTTTNKSSDRDAPRKQY